MRQDEQNSGAANIDGPLVIDIFGRTGAGGVARALHADGSVLLSSPIGGVELGALARLHAAALTAPPGSDRAFVTAREIAKALHQAGLWVLPDKEAVPRVIARLRKKLATLNPDGPAAIESARYLGYRLSRRVRVELLED